MFSSLLISKLLLMLIIINFKSTTQLSNSINKIYYPMELHFFVDQMAKRSDVMGCGPNIMNMISS